MMPSADEIARIRADIQATALPDECDIQTVSRVSDGQGGYAETWNDTEARVACRIDPIRGGEQVSGAAVQDFHGYIVTLPSDTTITVGQRIVIDTAAYNVRSVDTGKSWDGSVRVTVERV